MASRANPENTAATVAGDSFELRKALPSDCDGAWALVERASKRDPIPWTLGWSCASLRDEWEQGSGWVLLAKDDSFSSIQAFLIYRSLPGALEVILTAVAEEHRGKGAFRKLYGALLNEITTQEEVWLEVRADNAPALAAYRALGFGVVGRRAGYYRDGTDALLLSHSLVAGKSLL